MAVYVDDIQPHPHIDNYATRRHGHNWCHMIADSREELDALALRIGLRLQWRQKSGTIWEHYDLIPSKRTQAIKAGAIPISCLDMGRIWAAKLTPIEAT